MPTTTTTLLILVAAMELLLGLGLLLAPARTLERAFLPSSTPGAEAIVAARVAGAGLLSLGVLAAMTCRSANPAVLSPVLVTLGVYMALAAVNRFGLWRTIRASSSGAVAPGATAAWVSALLHLALAAALFLAWRQIP